MALSGNLIKVKDLSKEDIEQMYILMDTFFENLREDVFKSDLAEKDYVLQLRDCQSTIRGFTTLKLYDFLMGSEPIKLIYSGDTIIHKDFWGCLEFPRVWIRSIFSLVKGTGARVFWLLISKGYKTYRFLPVYYISYYPNNMCKTPEFEKSIMDMFGELKFGPKYDKHAGIIKMDGEKDYLRKGVAEITDKHLNDAHIRFFLEKNPGHIRGDELVCITEITKYNINKMGQRYLHNL